MPVLSWLTVGTTINVKFIYSTFEFFERLLEELKNWLQVEPTMTLLVIKTLYSAHTDSDSAGQDRIPSKYKHTFNQIPYNQNKLMFSFIAWIFLIDNFGRHYIKLYVKKIMYIKMTNKRFKIITFLTGATPSRGLLTLPIPPTNSLKVVRICEIWSSLNSLEMTISILNPLIILFNQSGNEGKIFIFRLKMHFLHFDF